MLLQRKVSKGSSLRWIQTTEWVEVPHHFRTRHPWLGPTTAGIHPVRSPGVQIEPCGELRQVKARNRSCSTVDRRAVIRAIDGNWEPGGRRPWMMVAFSDRARMANTKLTAALQAPLSGVGVTRRMPSLVTFGKERNSPKAKPRYARQGEGF